MGRREYLGTVKINKDEDVEFSTCGILFTQIYEFIALQLSVATITPEFLHV
ncbi:hypothetical protein MTR_7g091400 [Medicago truncatula]|uniref:Uncharacterized protein n=1 Tax=Medicago truncatula TaxID=3880 RepID=G7KTH9_MEDTR|nr:hypothetical protein MTR_7g091400 [Medicago truncatula]